MTKSPMKNRYKESAPLYTLVESRVSSDNIVSEQTPPALSSEIVTKLRKLGCEARVYQPDKATTAIEFQRPLVRGKVKIQSASLNEKNIVADEQLFEHQYLYRVDIKDYPSTVEKDKDVNHIADEINRILMNAVLITPAARQTSPVAAE
ncbi:MAG: hypothetical protein EOL87_15075 [Spartobacteria bacterium]|nr:hypothetical protein [Spartobacteria bacterium]